MSINSETPLCTAGTPPPLPTAPNQQLSQTPGVKKIILETFFPPNSTEKHLTTCTFPFIPGSSQAKIVNNKNFLPSHWIGNSLEIQTNGYSPVYIDWLKKLKSQKMTDGGFLVTPFPIGSRITVVRILRSNSKDYTITCVVKIDKEFYIMKCVDLDEDWAEKQSLCSAQQMRALKKKNIAGLCCNEGIIEAIGWACVSPSGYFGHINAYDIIVGNSITIIFMEMYDTTFSRLFKKKLYYENILKDSIEPNLRVGETIAAVAQIILCTLLPQKVNHYLCHNDFKCDNVMLCENYTAEYIYLKKVLDKEVVACLRIPTYGRIFKLIDFGFSSLVVKYGSRTTINMHSTLPHKTNVSKMKFDNIYCDIAQLAHSLLTTLANHDLIDNKLKPSLDLDIVPHDNNSAKDKENTDDLVKILHTLCKTDSGNCYPPLHHDKKWEQNFYVNISKNCHAQTRPDLFSLFEPYFVFPVSKIPSGSVSVDYFENWYEWSFTKR